MFYLSVILFTILLGATSCKDDNKEVTTPAEDPLFTEGQLVTSEFSKDDVVIESMVDTIVNLGSADSPALFYVNGEHQLNGAPIPNGNLFTNVFRSVSREDITGFIVIWGRIYEMNIDVNDQSAEAIALRHKAFYMLMEWLRVNNIDLPLLISLCNTPDELKSAISLVDASIAAANTPGEMRSFNIGDDLLRSIEMAGAKPSDLTRAIESKGLTEVAFLQLANKKGIDLSASLKGVASVNGEVSEVVEAVLEGLVYLSKILVKFIENGAPVVNIEDTYVSYLHQDDSNVMDYISSSDPIVSPTYSVAYCTLAKASFYLETYYNAKHETLPGQYINRSGMIVKSVTCSGGMHVEGSTTYNVPTTIGTDDNPIASTTGSVTVKYGDCCCFARVANLTFALSGDQGYVETSWDSNTK
jgi:hypothetical protein